MSRLTSHTVVGGLLEGGSLEDVAASLGTSYNSVRKWLSTTNTKLGVTTPKMLLDEAVLHLHPRQQIASALRRGDERLGTTSF